MMKQFCSSKFYGWLGNYIDRKLILEYMQWLNFFSQYFFFKMYAMSIQYDISLTLCVSKVAWLCYKIGSSRNTSKNFSCIQIFKLGMFISTIKNPIYICSWTRELCSGQADQCPQKTVILYEPPNRLTLSNWSNLGVFVHMYCQLWFCCIISRIYKNQGEFRLFN